MAVELILAAEAEQDVDEASWYEGRRSGLGEDFLSRVDACLQAICRTPKMHRMAHKQYRRGLVRQFPYAIFYEYSQSTVTVYAVMHTARDPEKWRERLP